MKIHKLFAMVMASMLVVASAQSAETVVAPVGKLAAIKGAAVSFGTACKTKTVAGCTWAWNHAKALPGFLYALPGKAKAGYQAGVAFAKLHPYVTYGVGAAAILGVTYGAYKWYNNRTQKRAQRELQEQSGTLHKDVQQMKEVRCYFHGNRAMHFNDGSVIRPDYLDNKKWSFCCETIDLTDANTIKNSGYLVRHAHGENYVCPKCALQIAQSRSEVAAQIMQPALEQEKAKLEQVRAKNAANPVNEKLEKHFGHKVRGG